MEFKNSVPLSLCTILGLLIFFPRLGSPRQRSLFLSRRPTHVCWIRPSKWVSNDSRHYAKKCYQDQPNLSEIDHRVPLNMSFFYGNAPVPTCEVCTHRFWANFSLHHHIVGRFCIPPKLLGAFGSPYDILVRSLSLTFPLLSLCLHSSHSQWIGFRSRQLWYFVGHLIVSVSLQIALDFLIIRQRVVV